MWVADDQNRRIYAYRVSDKARRAEREFNETVNPNSGSVSNIWSDGDTMWVTNIWKVKVHAYNMPPSAPKSLRAVAGNARVTLNWQHPGLAGITKYQYRYRRADSATWLQDWTDIPGSSYTTRSFTVSDLTNDATYVFSVRGRIGSNPEAAAKATATPLAPPAAPDAPEIAKLVAADGTLTAYWHTPEDDPRAPITGYRVQYRPYGSSTWRNVTRTNNVLRACLQSF